MNEIYEQIGRMADEISGRISEIRRDFHRYPELGWMEMRTSSLIARELKNAGCDEVLVGEQVCLRGARMGVPDEETLDAHYALAEAEGGDPEFLPYTKGGMTGVIGILRCGDGPTVAMRFDIDALPILENRTGEHFPVSQKFCSVHDGVMHACGHDGHTSVGIGTAMLLCRLRRKLHGTIKFIFQPAEEGVRGARAVVENGHLDDVNYLLAAHMGGNVRIKNCCIGIGSNHTMATTKMDVTYHGKAAHAALAPEAGNNAMLAMATAVLNLQAIPRHGQGSTRINVGKVTAGAGRNVICDTAKMELEVRGGNSAANDFMYEYAARIISHAAEMHECTSEIRLMGAARTDNNTPELMERVYHVCAEKMKMKVEMIPDSPGGGSEDYSYMSERVQAHGGQSCYFINLNHVTGTLHNEKFDFDEAALVNGVKAFCSVAADLMAQ